ncbi:hypothetical protein GUJ93_ZPchr0002g23871 [Zizania palustris]|uniref:Uncharacterized protein n=1 Tax=Zizania palustris TaxID=103762 RepID=A0A8J5VC28_ZIZPA|nr:hypothetical protein GUJ93_ZPchr0002g23871 [Zizania palustris]
MEEVVQLCAMKCSAAVDAARDTGDLCATQSLGNDVVESVVNVQKKVVCAFNQGRAAAICTKDSLASSRQVCIVNNGLQVTNVVDANCALVSCPDVTARHTPDSTGRATCVAQQHARRTWLAHRRKSGQVLEMETR